MIAEISKEFEEDLRAGIDTSLRPLTAGQMLWLEIQFENDFENE